MRGRMFIIALALAAVAVAFTVSRDGKGEVEAPANAVRLTFVYSPEKEPLLKPLIERFNAERHTSGARRSSSSRRSSPRATPDADRPRPPEADAVVAGVVVLGPAAQPRGRQAGYVADENPSIVRTPLVIAMWKRMAEAYGYPKRKLGYEQLVQLATGGWAAAAGRSSGASSTCTPTPTSRPRACPRSPAPTTRWSARRRA